MDEPSAAAGAGAPYTFINAMEIEAESVDTFIERWIPRSRHMASADGYLGATLYRAVTDDTRFKVVNVSNWTSRAAHEAATANPEYRRELDTLFGELPGLKTNRGHYRAVVHNAPADRRSDG